MQNTTGNMSDSQDDNAGGHEAELGRAATRLAEAIAAADAEALRVAAADHAAALGSQATAMAASIAKPVYSKLQEITDLLATQAKQSEALARMARDQAEQQTNLARGWLGDETKRRDAQADRLYSELDELRDGQSKTLAAVKEAVALELGKVFPRLGGVEAGVEALTTRVSDIGEEISSVKQDMTTVQADVALLKADVLHIKLDQQQLRTHVNEILAHIQKDRQLLQKWREQHGE